MIGASRGPRGEIRLGDIITHIGDRPIRNQDDYLSAMEQVKIGDTIAIRTRRGEDTRQFSVTLSASR